MQEREIFFTKYQGAGNDFVMIDNRDGRLVRQDVARYRSWCDRRFGVGADGLIFIQQAAGYDFEMVYFNADGSEGSMCGNGGRCAVRFASELGLTTGAATRFLAVDGPHEAALLPDGQVLLGMKDVDIVELRGEDLFIDTGSPHHIRWVNALPDYPVVSEGEKIRWSALYQPGGTNVNFVEEKGAGQLAVRTFERGVEAETLACGTGVTACALAYAWQRKHTGDQEIGISTPGGQLAVRFVVTDNGFRKIFLQGPAMAVFRGSFIEKI